VAKLAVLGDVCARSVLLPRLNIGKKPYTCAGGVDSLSEQVTVNGRKYNFAYKEPTRRTIIAISPISSSEPWTEEDEDAVVRLRQLLSQRLLIDSDPKLPLMLFVHKSDPNGNAISVPIEELRTTVNACLEEL
jgi:hypothetical protein